MSYPKHSTETYKGIEIEINYDQFAENPFEAWDGCVPLISESGRFRSNRSDYSQGQILEYLRNYLTYNQVKRNQRRIIEMMDKNETDKRFIYSYEDFKNDYPLNEYDRTEMLKDDLLYSWLDDGMDNLETFCKEFNIKHYRRTSRGYSQGDWADVFMCWTPEFGEVTGRTYESMTDKDFEDGFNLFTHWAWGDVFTFYIEETGDSCGGFYGDDFDNNGLLEMAKEEIDGYLEQKRKTKQSKLKTLIKNSVPYSNRKQILTQF